MQRKMKMPREEELYKPVNEYLTQKLKTNHPNCYLEVTAHGTFSETLKRVVGQDIVFSFLKTESPDLTGFILRPAADVRFAGTKDVKSFMTVEVKRGKVTLKDVYQAKRYGDLFCAEYALLVSLDPVPEEIRRLHRQLSVLNRFQGLKVRRSKAKGWKVAAWKVYIGQAFIKQLDTLTIEIQDMIWFPQTPF